MYSKQSAEKVTKSDQIQVKVTKSDRKYYKMLEGEFGGRRALSAESQFAGKFSTLFDGGKCGTMLLERTCLGVFVFLL